MGTAGHKTHRKTFSLLLALIILAGAGIWFVKAKQPGIKRVILISIDTCRADRLGCYGYDKAETGVLDTLAAEGILFTKAQTPVPLTLPSHSSMLTGTYPPYHRVHDNFDVRLDAEQVTLAEILKQEGFATGAIVSSMVLREGVGLNQGFDSYNDQFGVSAESTPAEERTAEPTSQLAVEFIEQHQEEPFFLFLHYFDPHFEYNPPEPFSTKFADDLYSGEIAYTDQCIGVVMDQLKNLGLYDSTLIIIVGDHGESLGEHGESFHGYYIYQSTIHVPFIIKMPGVSRSIEVDENVSLVDVMPTILSCLDLPIPAQVQGEDLSGYFQTDSPLPSDRFIYTESIFSTAFGCNPLIGGISDRWNYIHTNHAELYDLVQDPKQVRNLLEQEAQQARYLENELAETLARIIGAESAESHIELDVESRKRLESLGYVGGAFFAESMEWDPAKKDAKEMIQYYEYKQQAGYLITNRKFEMARDVCEKMISQWPEAPTAYSMMIEISFLSEDYAETINSVNLYPDLFSRPPGESQSSNIQITNADFITLYMMMIVAAKELDQLEAIIEYSDKYLELNPDGSESPWVYNMQAQAYFRQGRHEMAFKLWSELLRTSPASAEVHAEVGQAYYQIGDLTQAETYLNRALRLQPGLVQVRNNLQVISNLKRMEQSITEYSEMLRQSPDDPALNSRLGFLYFQKGLHPQAADYWRAAIRLNPNWYEPYINLAGLLATTKDPNLQNPQEALKLAEKAAQLNEFEDANLLETYSHILAANKKYTEAINIAEKAATQARRAGNKALVENLNQLIIQFKLKEDDR